MDERLHKREERKLTLGEPAAYQASLHRFGVGMGSLRPLEQRAVRDLLACSRWPRATTSPSSMVVDAWAGGCTCGRYASLDEPAAYQARRHDFGVVMHSLQPPE